MVISAANTTDKEGREYRKIFSNMKTGAIYCNEGSNRKLLTEPNFSVRTGKGKYGDEVVLQFKILENKEDYKAKSEWNHIETYFDINIDTLELFEGITAFIRSQLIKKEEKTI